MFTRDMIIAGVMSILRNQVECARPGLTSDLLPCHTIGGDLGLDELDVMDVMIRTEETFGVTLPDVDLRHEATPGGVTVVGLIEMVVDALRERAAHEAWNDWPTDDE